MARACGMRIGSRHFEIVVLDGGPKKHNIQTWISEEYTAEGDGGLAQAAARLEDVIAENRIPLDNVGLAIDTGLAAFRKLSLPFKDKAKIEQVLKFEVEGDLPQYNIDDVVVDFITLDEGDDSCSLMTMAVPKKGIKPVLDVCEEAGFDPIEVELEATAMANAAITADLCTLDNAQVLVHVGELSTSVVVMDGGRIRDMRAIRIGALSHEALMHQRAVEMGEDDSDDKDGDDGPKSGLQALTPVTPMESQRRLDQAVKRIRRELGRTVSGARTLNQIDAIYVCGLDLPGLIGSDILDVPVQALEAFDKDAGHPQEFSSLVVAYGAAVQRLGGGSYKAALRREDMRFTGAFEKLELPLAVFCLLLVTLLGVHTIFAYKRLLSSQAWSNFWMSGTVAYLDGDPVKGIPPRLRTPTKQTEAVLAKLREDLADQEERLPELDHWTEAKRLKSFVEKDVKDVKRDLGEDSALEQPPSAFAAVTLVMSVLEEMGDKAGRPSIRLVDANPQKGRGSEPDRVKVGMTIVFYADNSLLASNAYTRFVDEMKRQPWCVEVEDRGSDSLDDTKGIVTKGLNFIVDPALAQAN